MARGDGAGGRATILDVARLAGVSRQTVSNTVNHPERVAPETLDRVQGAIEELRFRPHITAQQLRRRRASAYGFEINPGGVSRMGHILDEFLVELTLAAPEHRSHLVTFAAESGDALSGYRHLLDSGLVDGFVLANTRPDDPRPAWLAGHGVRFVSFGRMWGHPELTNWVDVDGRQGVRDAVAHLDGQGYRQVAFLGWPAGSPVADDRRRGWLEGLADAGLTPTAAEESVQEIEQATCAADRLLGRLAPGAAVVCASDLLALGALRAARGRSLIPGVDLGVVGFDDSDVSEAVQLTSIRQPLREAAQAAWQLLAEPQDTPRPTLLTPTLRVRASTNRTGPRPPTQATPGRDTDPIP